MEILAIHVFHQKQNVTDLFFELRNEVYNAPDEYIYFFIKDENCINNIIKTVNIEFVKRKQPTDGFKEIISHEKFQVFIYGYQKFVITVTCKGDYKRYILLNIVHSVIDKINNDKLSLLAEDLIIRNNDKIGQIQENLDEVKTIMAENIDNILKRGEKLETLLLKSEALSEESRKFVISSKKLNRWCCQFI